MNRYSSYKDSGVAWIDEIPEHWKQIKLKHQFKIQKGKIPTILYDEFKDGLIPYLSMDVLRGSTSLNFTDANDGIFVSRHQILILWDGSNSGEIIKIENDGILSSTMGVLNTVNCYLNNEFSFYQLKYNEAEIRNNTNGMGIPHVDGGYVRNLPLFVPPLHEQEQIVSYLDKKTAIVDALIASKVQKINLLKENRTALINHVITKGLDPNVKLKDSGVEWIGEIPEHWEVKKIKYCLNHISQKGTTKLNDIKISPENVESDTGICFNYHSEYEGEGMKFSKGDILLNKLRVYLKKIVLTDCEGYSMGEMIVLRTINGFNKYFYFTLFNQLLINFWNTQANGVKLPRVSPDIILNTKTVFPPLDEQIVIVQYIDTHTQEIDELISLEGKKIATLKEYRQALISEVVTGKIKVVN